MNVTALPVFIKAVKSMKFVVGRLIGEEYSTPSCGGSKALIEYTLYGWPGNLE